MKKPLTAFCLAFATSFSIKALASGPDSYPMSPVMAFDTLDEAAVAALKLAASQSQDIEFGGCLFSENEKFYFTTPVTMGASGEFSANCLMPRNSFAGIYHTHPSSGPQHKLFSTADLKMAMDVGKISYVGVLERPISKVIRFDPNLPAYRKCENSNSSACARLVNETPTGLRF